MERTEKLKFSRNNIKRPYTKKNQCDNCKECENDKSFLDEENEKSTPKRTKSNRYNKEEYNKNYSNKKNEPPLKNRRSSTRSGKAWTSEEQTKIRNGKPTSYFIKKGTVVGVNLSYFDSVFYFESKGLDLKINNSCIVSIEKGEFWGKVCAPIRVIEENAKTNFSAYGSVLRIATDEDAEKRAKNVAMEKKAFKFCNVRIKARNLKMKLVKVIFRFDRSKAIFLFTADGRIDFRDLVKDLAGEFHTRIEMRQIGVRDEASMFGGYGCCGRLLCCSAYRRTFIPVSIRMAKVQSLTLDPVKISGGCGRLMCCLGYEYKTYEQMRKELPRFGEKVTTGDESGSVVNLDVLKKLVYVDVGEGKVIKVDSKDLKRAKR